MRIWNIWNESGTSAFFIFLGPGSSKNISLLQLKASGLWVNRWHADHGLLACQIPVVFINEGWITCGVHCLLRKGHKKTQWFSRWWFQIFVIFIPTWGKIPILTNIFQMGWNHQLGLFEGFLFLTTNHAKFMSQNKLYRMVASYLPRSSTKHFFNKHQDPLWVPNILKVAWNKNRYTQVNQHSNTKCRCMSYWKRWIFQPARLVLWRVIPLLMDEIMHHLGWCRNPINNGIFIYNIS